MFGGVSHDEVTGWVSDLYTTATDFDQLLELVGTAHRLKNFADAAMVELTRLAADCPTGEPDDDTGTANASNTGSSAGPPTAGTTALLLGATKQSAKEAAAAAKRAALFARVPALGDAQARGEIGAAHVDALIRTLARATISQRDALLSDPTALIDTARSMSPEQFQTHCDRLLRDLTRDDGTARAERQRRDSYLRTWTDDTTGMVCGRFELDPERGARVRAALDAQIQQLFAERPDDSSEPTSVLLGRLGAQALCDLMAHGHATHRPNDADLHVLIDHDTLVRGLHDHSVCELSDGTQIPVGLARRLACNAKILPVLLGSDGEVLDLGREQRLATRAQRRALRAMYRTCAAPGCTVTFDRCDIHHIHWWEVLGPTDLANLVPLCTLHHHLVHEGGWHLSIAPNRDLTLIRPDGEIHAVARFVDHSRGVRRDRTRPPGRPDADPPGGPGSRRRPPPGHDRAAGHETQHPQVDPAPDLFTHAG